MDEDEERDADEEWEKVNAAFLSEFEDLGWEGRIVSQFIMSVGRATRGSSFTRSVLKDGEDQQALLKSNNSDFDKKLAEIN